MICDGAFDVLIVCSVDRSEPVPESALLVRFHWIRLPLGTVTPPGATIVPPLAITMLPATPLKFTVEVVCTFAAGVAAGPITTLPPLRVETVTGPLVVTCAICSWPSLTTLSAAPAAARFADSVPSWLPLLPSVTPPTVVETSKVVVVAGCDCVTAPAATSVKAPAWMAPSPTAFLSV